MSKSISGPESTLAPTPFGSSFTLGSLESIILSDSDTELGDSDKENQVRRAEGGVSTVEDVVHIQQSRTYFTRDNAPDFRIYKDSVHHICSTPTTPSKRCGRQPLMNTPTRKRLIDSVQQSAVNRRIAVLDGPRLAKSDLDG